MELFFYRGSQPNFGDELNTWMWPKLLEGVWDSTDNQLFLGIGSILFDYFPQDKRKIVFGSGYGGYTPLPTIDESWKVYFLRGKLTAKALGLNEALGVGDSAILLRSCVNTSVTKKHKISFVPHWETIFDGNWQQVCELAGIHYIDPCADVEVVLEDILSSELVLTEAMHGAIVSDALRVPWIPLRPISAKHHMKWYDWASALDINLNPQVFRGSNFYEEMLMFSSKYSGTITHKIKYQGKAIKNILPGFFMERAAERLIEISRLNTQMSTDAAIANSHDKMVAALYKLTADLGVGKVLL